MATVIKTLKHNAQLVHFQGETVGAIVFHGEEIHVFSLENEDKFVDRWNNGEGDSWEQVASLIKFVR
jgi:hypothetical protein